ncbi:hypothetical protein SAMN05421823_103699 [Catalinimonas alkaloidigena]|uniref:Uncharacterized protein n=1 Tax=Catalinimonas alkaloidigena TaxID=1075417 RepID=A0A1G9F809_9BACT|nr:hypothetical protein [Catalinimonas alkaloidigena]SDK84475.1 hypothetical protein SAMN05421823_103699 [Catalinimonas alkaloidigena]
MLVKPKSKSLVAIVMFLVLGYAVLGTMLVSFTRAPRGWLMVAIPLTIILMVGITLKMLWDYKVIRLTEGKFYFRQPLLFRQRTFDLRQLDDLQETSIKTWNGTFRQLEIHFGPDRITINQQEHEGYDALHRALKKHHTPSRKRAKRR